MEDQSTFPNIANSFTKTSRRPRMIVFVILFLALLGILIYVGSRFLGSSKKKPADAITPTIAATITLAPTETPTSTGSLTPTKGTTNPTPSKSPSTTPKPTAKGTTTQGLDRAALTISVQNGSGVKGAAATMATTLKDLGYTVSATGNADNFDYTNVTIQVKSTKTNFLQQLKKDLSTNFTVTAATADLPASAETDAVVIVGK